MSICHLNRGIGCESSGQF